MSTRIHIQSLPLLPQSGCVSKGDCPSHLAVLTELGQVTNTALNEPASLFGTKQLQGEVT